MKKVIVIDDHPAIRLAIKGLLEKWQEFSIVDESDNGQEGLEKIRQHKPDLVVLDLCLPRSDGLALIRRIKGVDEKIKILVLTGQEERIYAVKAAEEGANGYVTKSKDMMEVYNAASAVMSGYNCFPAEDILASQGRPAYGKATDALSSLSVRELAIMRYIAKGYSNKEISEIFYISQKTVSTYKARVLNKLKLKNSIAIAEFAKTHGLV
ncbi:response regulator transcription factor [Paludibacterium paludis]|uniref:DNA-binding response regulator n=1 Tax=Paludibacterium paludis TaxID=1225769 RepID=A0A918U8C1_9NEIS|nr:response regulator transcription factor [Paludibacterium paludis]GGY08390.1 DNA-binding response regulator [Paludibacterium paludis]